MYWFNPQDPLSIAAVVAGTWCETQPVDNAYAGPLSPDYEESAVLALEVASDILFRLSGFSMHPGGIAEDDFRCAPLTHRLTPNFRPIRQVIDINRVTAECEMALVTEDVCLFGQDVYFSKARCALASWYWDVCSCRPLNLELLRMRYRFGSTLTAAARRAVLYFAHQFWLECNPGAGECQLPERTTNVNREGLSYTIFDPQSYLEQGKTGLPAVDLWLSSVNNSKVSRPAGVWTPDSAPAVNASVVWNWDRDWVQAMPV